MDMLLTGTGPAGGFPVPDCPCASCRSTEAAVATGSPRPGAAPPRRPAELRLGDRYRLDVDGVLHDGESHGGTHRLRAGERLELPGITVLAVAEDPSCLLIQPDDAPSLLWAPQAGRITGTVMADLATGLAGVPLGTVVLGPAAEDDPDEPQQAPTPVQSALTLARLRAAGVVDAATDCVLVGLGHRQGPTDRLALCVEHWRVRVPPDGSRLPAGAAAGAGRRPPAAGSPVPGGRTLVLGGSASGKSGLAEDLLAAEPHVLYTATGPVVDLRTSPDAEWAQRVRRHRERRPAWWQTEETHLVAELLWKAGQPILLDSIGTWLTGVLDRAGAWQDLDDWRDRVAVETDDLVRAWRARRTPLVAVSDEVGLGVVPGTTAGRLFRDELGRLNRRLADESEQVLVVVAGRLLASPGSAVDPGLGVWPDTGVGDALPGPQ